MSLLAAYAGLFLWSFLAATVLPLSSEAALAALVYAENQVALPVVVATAGNFLGACTTYLIGRRLGAAGERRLAERGATRAGRASLALMKRYGQPALLLSWVPLVGDLLVGLAGLLHVPFRRFAVWVLLGKAARYLLVALAAAALL